jgi:DNA-binding FadR family transcriptional regulator
VSRATVRAALTELATEGLLRTVKGVGGGSFITTPSPDRVSDALNLAVTLMSQNNGVTLDELLEVREYLEIPATRLAAQRRTDLNLQHMAQSIPERPLDLSVSDQFVNNRDFHKAVLEAAGNTLLMIAAEPIFSVLQTRLSRSALGPSFHRNINLQHRQISEAIAAGDADLAERRMRDHLAWLRPRYQKIWHDVQDAAASMASSGD